MRQTLFTIALFFLFPTTKAQCPAGAEAYVTFYMPWHIEPGGPVTDTFNGLSAMNFQPNSTVYFYTIYNTLIDSARTSPEGYGYANLPSLFIDSLLPQFSLGALSLGFASNGICTTNLKGLALLPVKISRFTVENRNNHVVVSWQTEMDEPGIKYIIQQSDDGASFSDIKQFVSVSSNTGRYSYSGLLPVSTTKYFRIKVTDKEGRIYYSETKNINTNNTGDVVVYSSGPTVSAFVPVNYINGTYTIYNTTGRLLSSNKILSANFTLGKYAAAGICFVKFTNKEGKSIIKSFVVSE